MAIHLIALRHGSAGWGAGGDHARPLTSNGAAMSRAIGRYLTGRGLAPDLALVSPATRTVQTFEEAHAAGGWTTPAMTHDELYNGSAYDALELCAAATRPDGQRIDRLILVSHQPTVGPLVEHLTGEWVGISTGTAAVIGIDAEDWTAIDEAPANLVDVVRPHDLPDDLFAELT